MTLLSFNSNKDEEIQNNKYTIFKIDDVILGSVGKDLYSNLD